MADRPGRLGEIILEQLGQFPVHACQLTLVKADDKGHQPEGELPFLAPDPD